MRRIESVKNGCNRSGCECLWNYTRDEVVAGGTEGKCKNPVCEHPLGSHAEKLVQDSANFHGPFIASFNRLSFETKLSALETDFRIVSTKKFTVACGIEILGVGCELPFTGRHVLVKEIANLVAEYNSNNPSKNCVVIISGSPGSGKSRMLVEVSNAIEKLNHNVLHLFVTFNNVTKLTNDETSNFSVSSFILCRLLFQYTEHKSKSWDEFLQQKRAILENLTLETVIEYILSSPTFADIEMVIIYVDECLMGLNLSLLGHNDISNLISKLYTLNQCKTESKAVKIRCLFTCFASDFLVNSVTESGRRIKKFYLPCITTEDSVKLIKHIIQPCKNIIPDIEREYTRLAVIFGGFPRLYSYLDDFVKNAINENVTFLCAKLLVYKVAEVVALNYSFPFEPEILLISLCGLEIHESFLHVTKNNVLTSLSIDQAVLNGYMEESDSKAVDFSIARVMSQFCSNPIVRKLFMFLFSTPDSGNLLEELVQYRFVIQFRLYKTISDNPRFGHYLPKNLTTLLPYVSVLYGTFDREIQVDLDDSVDDTVLVFEKVPGPLFANKYFSRVLRPLNSNEAGIDAIIPLKSKSGPIILAIQNKDYSSTIDGPAIVRTILLGFLNLTRCGWKLDQIYFVFICHGTFPDYLWKQMETTNNSSNKMFGKTFDALSDISVSSNIGFIGYKNSVVSSSGNFDQWCGPTFLKIVKSFLDFGKRVIPETIILESSEPHSDSKLLICIENYNNCYPKKKIIADTND